MNKTLYLRDEDSAVWDRARELAGEKLSPVIVTGLKRFIAEKETEEALAKGFCRIEVSFNDSEEHGIPKKKAFTGRWIFPPYLPDKWTSEQGIEYYYALALTARGSVVVYSWRSYSENPKDAERFRVFSSLEEAAAVLDLNSTVRRAMETVGILVEELDI